MTDLSPYVISGFHHFKVYERDETITLLNVCKREKYLGTIPDIYQGHKRVCKVSVFGCELHLFLFYHAVRCLCVIAYSYVCKHEIWVYSDMKM